MSPDPILQCPILLNAIDLEYSEYLTLRSRSSVSRVLSERPITDGTVCITILDRFMKSLGASEKERADLY